MISNFVDQKKVAAIEYHGSDGITDHCLKAIARIIHYGDIINEAKLLSYFSGFGGAHSFLLNINYDNDVVIKSGFSSGYNGEGPRGLSMALQILIRHNVEIDEYEINSKMHGRLNSSCLLQSDIDQIKNQIPIRPSKYYDYIYENRKPGKFDGSYLDSYFPPSINFGLLDDRLIDLALVFFDNPDSALSVAFRRLEDIVRKRIGKVDEHGSKLLVKAFEGNNSVLHWGDTNGGEHGGKANLFKAVFLAYRNPRAHQEVESNDKEFLREFMLINELYLLERAAIKRPSEESKA